MADFFEVVSGQRACRSFQPDVVPDADLERILAAATHAPSAENLQPWVFVVVTDAERRGDIADVAAEAWDTGGAAYAQRRLSEAFFADVDQGVRQGLRDAPVSIVVGVDTDVVHEVSIGSSIFP